MRVITNIILKEARELLTPQMLAPFVAIMVVFVFIGRTIRGERAKSSQPQTVIVADRDKTALSDSVRAGLASDQTTVVPAEGNLDQLLALAKDAGATWLVVIPESLEQRIQAFKTAQVEVYNIVHSFSIMQMEKGVKLKSLFDAANERLARAQLARAYPGTNPGDLQNPLRTSEFVVVKDRVAPGNAEVLSGLVMSQTFMIPIVLLLVLVYSSQMIAASIGQEKENKTLETLLTVPISRTGIVIGKMVGAALVALVVSGLYMLAMVYWTGSFGAEMSAPAGAAAASAISQLGLSLGPLSYVLLAVGLFLAVLCGLSLATLLAIFADDAKSAQMTVMPLMMVVMIPYFLGMFINVEAASLPIKIVMYAIPFSYPFLMPKAMLFGDYGLVFIGFAYLAVFAAACIFTAARLFSSDRLLTMKLRWLRWRRFGS
ncbi:MAG TPA: ABC transporter permease [bacterium]|nr:ABC transporter permease [bacterium]